MHISRCAIVANQMAQGRRAQHARLGNRLARHLELLSRFSILLRQLSLTTLQSGDFNVVCVARLAQESDFARNGVPLGDEVGDFLPVGSFDRFETGAESRGEVGARC